jgi:hypothetical protein
MVQYIVSIIQPILYLLFIHLYMILLLIFI